MGAKWGWVRKLSREREYWIIYRGPGFLAVVWFDSTSTPSPLPPFPLASCFSFSVFLCVRRPSLLTGEGGGGLSRNIWPQESLALYKSSILSAHRPSSLCSSFTHIRMMASSFRSSCYFYFSSGQTLKGQPSKLGIWRLYWRMQLHFDMVSWLSGSETWKYEISW